MPPHDHSKPEHRCIVLPFQPLPGQNYDGVGLALHFLLGNVVVLHSGLKELWFGWRLKKLFDGAAHLADYCRGARLKMELKGLSQQQNIRFWVYGQYTHQVCKTAIYDSQTVQTPEADPVPFSCADHLVQFRQSFLDRFDQTGLTFPHPQKSAALWEEKISLSGLDAIGRALETFYRASSFHPGGVQDLGPFEKAVAVAPNAFMAHDLMGWACYRQSMSYRAVLTTAEILKDSYP
jgi:hypothetical protein